MKTFTIELPESLMINLKKNGQVQVNLKGKSPEWVLWAISMGVRQSCGDADASLKDAPETERAQAIKDKFDSVNKGAIPAGGGTRHTPEELGFLAALKAEGFSILRIETGEVTNSGKKRTKAEPVSEALSRYVDERAKEFGIEVNDEVTKIVIDGLKALDSFQLAAGLKKDTIDASKLAAIAAAQKAEK